MSSWFSSDAAPSLSPLLQPSWSDRSRWRLGVTSLTLTLGSLLLSSPALAQIIPDHTLGPEQTQVLLDGVVVNNEAVDVIQSGAQRGANLFHSFEQFNIDAGQRVYFANPSGVDRILSRVTGELASNIDGTLGSLGSADIFLLNPNGIIFGPDARLDIAGSFMASTADSFSFADGSTFSAINPEAPPLLTVNLAPGLQYGQTLNRQEVGDRPIESAGLLKVGESLTLAGGNLRLSGQLEAGDHLRLRAEDTIRIRDSESSPFRAIATNNIRIRGTHSIDISALSHPESELVAGQNLVLRSDAPAIIDGHFAAGQDFRIEQLNGERGRSLSLDDPIIRADGDVSLQDYTGASLHILAGGSVTIPGPITITGADTLDNALQEQVTLSDGETVVDIDGSVEPTLDVRAGLRLRSAAVLGGDRSGDIVLGDIRNPGGTVFVTNQYRPNLALDGGTIQIGAIDTSVARSTAGTARGGDVVIDSRGDIDITGDVITSAQAGSFSLDSFGEVITDNDFNPIVEFAGNRVRTFGGDIVLLSEDNITTQSLNTSAIAAAQGLETRTLQADGTELVQREGARAIARGGTVTVATAVDHSNQSVRSSLGNIEMGAINTSARVFADASADASLTRNADPAVGDDATVVNTDNAGVAIGGSANARAEGGNISLGTQVVTGTIAAASDVGRIRTDNLNSSAAVRADASANASINIFAPTATNSGNAGEATGGTIGDTVSRAGAIALATDVNTGDINAESTIGSIEPRRINASAVANVDAIALARVNVVAQTMADNSGNGGTVVGGTIGESFSRGGTIRLGPDITTGNITARSDIGNIQTSRINARVVSRSNADAYAEVNAAARGSNIATVRNRGHGGTATGGTLDDGFSQGGTVTLDTQIVTGHIMDRSDIGRNTVAPIVASALVEGYAAATSNSRVSANSFNDSASAENSGDGGEASGGITGDVMGIGGTIAITTVVMAGDIAAEADIGTIDTETVNVRTATQVRSDALTSTTASASASYADARNSGTGGTAQAGESSAILGQGGTVGISANVQLGTLASGSDIGYIRTEDTNTSVYTVADSEANSGASSTVIAFNRFGTDVQVDAENTGDGGISLGGMVDSASAKAGPVTLSTAVSTGDIYGRSDIGRLQAGNINTSSYGRVDAFADADANAFGDGTNFVDPSIVSVDTENQGNGGTSTGGAVPDVFADSGSVVLSTQILTNGTMQGPSSPSIGMLDSERITTTSTALADVSANAGTLARSFTMGSLASGRDTGILGQEAGGIATAIAQGGRIVLTTDLASDTSGQWPSQSGAIANNSPINTFARALVDAIAEGEESASDPVNFIAMGGPITVDSDGPIHLGANSQLNASAGFFVIRLPENFVSRGTELQGGDISLAAQGPIDVTQISAETNAEFEIDGERVTAETLASAGGRLDLRTPNVVRLRDRTAISVAATGGTGEAGDITIGAQSLVLGEQSTLSSQTQSGNGGNITITLGPDLGELLVLGPESSISTTAGTEEQGGNGGNIAIDARFIVTLAQNNSDITANAFTGAGGQVQIVSDGLFGIAFREQPTDFSDITASSIFGTSGDVTIEAPDTDPNQAIAELPSAFVAPEIVRSCQEQFTQTLSQFTITGRGGLPQSPLGPFSSVPLWQDLLPIEPLESMDWSNENEHNSISVHAFRRELEGENYLSSLLNSDLLNSEYQQQEIGQFLCVD